MEQFNAENHLEYPFNFIFYKSLQVVAAQTMLCEQRISVWNFNVSKGIINQSPLFPDCWLLCLVISHLSWEHDFSSFMMLYKASSHVIMWRQPCNISFKICFVLLDWHLENAFSFIMCQHLIVIDVLNILNFFCTRQQPKEPGNNQWSPPKLIYKITLNLHSSNGSPCWTVQNRSKLLHSVQMDNFLNLAK